jgi:amino acid adenylation domain-containing protein
LILFAFLKIYSIYSIELDFKLIKMKAPSNNNFENVIKGTEMMFPKNSLYELFAEQAAISPNSIAIEFENRQLTYAELDKMINQLANYLWAQGMRPGQIVAVSLEQSPNLITTLFAILQCGGTYLPLDPKFPSVRLEFMLNDSDAIFLLTSKNISSSLPNTINTILIEDILYSVDFYPILPLGVKISNDSNAYIIYTSGSTGKPKGVTITHKNLVNFLYSMAIEPGINKEDKLLSITTISFDIAGLELFLPLLNGAKLFFANYETTRDGQLLLNLLQDKKITILQATPTTWQLLLDSGWKNPLPLKALCGGEDMPLNLAQQLISRCNSLWNMYGPTETTIWSTLKKINAEESIITIGKPIANTQIYLLNEEEQTVALGTIGEIVIGGDGVASGYWKRPELTSEKFFKNPFSTEPNSFLYRTGDLGKLSPTGELQCIGRIDNQVKIRGHRIELGEIEAALNSLPGVKQSAVILKNYLENEAKLVAFLKLNKKIHDEKLIKDSLSKILPEILLPSKYIWVDNFPITPNGKIDRKALLEYKSTNKNHYKYTTPRTETEKLVAEIWKECLNLDTIDIFSNFFEMGGHSLIAAKVMSKLEQKTGKRLPFASLFEYSTIEKLALLLKKDEKFITWDSLVPIKPNGNKTPLYIVHGAGLNVLIFHALAKNLDENQPVFGLQAKGLNGIDEPLETIEEIASYYINSIIKSCPDGPYALAGYSFGGIIAYEMAHQLTESGKKVTMVGLLDTNVNKNSFYNNPIRKTIEKTKIKLINSFWVIGKMLSDWDHAKERLRTRKKGLLNIYLTYKYGKEKLHELNHNQPYKLDRINKLAGNKYQIVPRTLKVDLFRVDDKYNYRQDRKTLGWGKVALKGVEVHDIPGHHFELFSPPNDLISARILQKVLDKRNAEI